MFSKIGIINVLLAFLFIFFVVKTYGVWKTDNHITSEQQLIEKATSHSEKKVVHRRLLPDSYHKNVVERCLFSPDRCEFISEVSESEPDVLSGKIPGGKIILYGIVMMKDCAMALVSNPDIKPGDEPELWVKTGDGLGTFKVGSILQESILLTDGDNEYKIPLYEPSKSRQRSMVAKTATPTVVTTSTKSKENDSQKPEAPTVVTTPTKPKKNDSQKPETPKPEELSDDQYEIIKTPFGEFKRKKK
jgi:hypothetical protein